MVIRQAYPFDAPSIAAVSIESWRTTYDGIIPADFLARLSRSGREAAYEDRLSFITGPTSEFAYVAEDEDRIVGFAYAGPRRTRRVGYLGEIYALYVLEEYQRQGIGQRLVSAVANHFLSHGLDSLIIWVLIYNPACAFYEALGGSIVAQSSIDIGTTTLLKIAYGWEDIRTIALPVRT
jgi:GNAT superfamily N-acetyltransferase